MPLPSEVAPEVIAFYEQWLKDGDLTKEETEYLEKLLSKEKNWKVLKSGVHGRQLTDKEVSSAKKAQEEFEKKQKEVLDLQTTLATTSTKDKEKISKLEKELERRTSTLTKAEQNRLKVAQTLREYENGDTLVKELGLEEPIVTSDDLPTPSKTKEKEAPSSFTKEELLAELRTALSSDLRSLAQWTPDYIRMREEYKDLTGKELPMEEFLQKVVSNKGDYQATFLKDYNIETLREKRKEETIRKQVEAELREEFEKQRAKDLIPSSGGRPADSAFFKAIDEGRTKEEKEEAHIPTGVTDKSAILSEAVADFTKRAEKREALGA